MNSIREITTKKLGYLRKILGKSLILNAPLAPKTTFKIGGNAAAYIAVKNADELATAVSAARACDVDYFLLGAGANILIGDHGYPGLLIHNLAQAAHIDGNLLHADSGAMIYPEIIELSVNAGLSGLEHYVGIPSTVGGALWQNLHFLYSLHWAICLSQTQRFWPLGILCVKKAHNLSLQCHYQ